VHLWNEVFRRAFSTALDNPATLSFLADVYRGPRRRRRFWPIIDRYQLHLLKKRALAVRRHASR
jgi:hypothetical protein